MRCLIGGPGSSGSSLLSAKIGVHSNVLSLPELSLFNKPDCYSNWRDAKHLLFGNSRKLETKGWFPYPGTQLDAIDLGWSRAGLEFIAQNSKSLLTFSDKIFSKKMKMMGAPTWVEKTPSNSYCFSQFLRLHDDNRVILCVRNPQDSIASLVNRGMTEFFAAASWAYNTQAALAERSSSRFMLVKYENFVLGPETTLSRVCDFLGADFLLESRAISFQSSGMYEKLPSWSGNPGGPIKPGLSTFGKLPLWRQDRIRAAINSVKVLVQKEGQCMPQRVSCAELASDLSYDVSQAPESGSHFLYPQLATDWTKRAVLGYATKLRQYPARIEP